jgi:hypothetical protein
MGTIPQYSTGVLVLPILYHPYGGVKNPTIHLQRGRMLLVYCGTTYKRISLLSGVSMLLSLADAITEEEEAQSSPMSLKNLVTMFDLTVPYLL